jgi:hypothetical protein
VCCAPFCCLTVDVVVYISTNFLSLTIYHGRKKGGGETCHVQKLRENRVSQWEVFLLGVCGSKNRKKKTHIKGCARMIGCNSRLLNRDETESHRKKREEERCAENK